jgi:hypothetical protein
VTEFDPIRALREEIAGLADVHKVITANKNESESELAEAEARHNAFLKMAAFMSSLLEQLRARLKALEADAAK